MKQDINTLLRILRPNLLPVLESAWAKVAEGFPQWTPADIAEPFREVLDKWWNEMTSTKDVEFRIVMGTARQRVTEEFIQAKVAGAKS